QNRHGGAPRGERPASWDARRLARRLARCVISAFTRVFDATWRAQRVLRRAPERLSALRPPLDGDERSNDANTGAQKRAAGTRRCVLMDEVIPLPSCFETPRACARLLSMRAGPVSACYLQRARSPSCAGLTRASIVFAKSFLRSGMDCRVKPGNDGVGGLRRT